MGGCKSAPRVSLPDNFKDYKQTIYSLLLKYPVNYNCFLLRPEHWLYRHQSTLLCSVLSATELSRMQQQLVVGSDVI